MNLFNMVPYKKFAGVNKLKDIVKEEISHEEKNYEPVSSEDKNTFLSNSGFAFEEKPNSTLMTLSKTKGNYEIKVMFTARPPTPSEDQEHEHQEGEEKGNNIKHITT